MRCHRIKWRVLRGCYRWPQRAPSVRRRRAAATGPCGLCPTESVEHGFRDDLVAQITRYSVFVFRGIRNLTIVGHPRVYVKVRPVEGIEGDNILRVGGIDPLFYRWL